MISRFECNNKCVYVGVIFDELAFLSPWQEFIVVHLGLLLSSVLCYRVFLVFAAQYIVESCFFCLSVCQPMAFRLESWPEFDSRLKLLIFIYF